MKIMAIVTLASSAKLSEVGRLLKDELRGSWKLFSENIIREAYATDDPARIVFVLETVDVAAARTHVQTLPLVRQGDFDMQLIELRPFANWARLFS
jgi:hypothetical protein